MPLQTQVKLLRVLETGEFMRVGSGDLRKVDVRVIAASNRNLATMVQEGYFRKDLYYRLKAVSLHLPPLRERKENILLLLEKFSAEFVAKNKLEFGGFSPEAKEVLLNYSWPGNVRELRNFVETVVILAKGQEVTSELAREHLSHYEEPIEANVLPIPVNRTVEQAERELIYKALVSLGVEVREMKNMLGQIMEKADAGSAGPAYYPYHSNMNDDLEIKSIEEVEREMIEKALAKFRGNRRQAARALNISERTLYRKIKDYDLV